MSKKFIPSIHYFRGIAILLIVMGHCGGLIPQPPLPDHSSLAIAYTVLHKTIENLIRGGTSLFVFISGLLFHHVFYAKFVFKTFIQQKLKNVIAPYSVMSFPLLWMICFNAIQNEKLGIFTGIKQALFAFLFGKYDLILAYWYIPFIFVIFLASPLFIAYIQRPEKHQILFITASTVCSAIIHRPIWDTPFYHWSFGLNILHACLYFLPIYCFGIYASIHRERLCRIFLGKQQLLLGIVCTLAVLQAIIFAKTGSLHKDLFSAFAGIDISLFQKICLCLLLLVFLSRFDQTPKIISLDLLAKYSFSVFFLHEYVILLLHNIGWVSPVHNILMTIPIGVGISAICIAFAYVVKLPLKQHSRLVIGS